MGRDLHRWQLRTGKKGGACVGKTKKGKGTKWMVVVDGEGIPLGSTLTSASPAEVTLAESTLEAIKVPRRGRGRPKKRPKRLIADRGYDSETFENLATSPILCFKKIFSENFSACGQKLGNNRSIEPAISSL